MSLMPLPKIQPVKEPEGFIERLGAKFAKMVTGEAWSRTENSLTRFTVSGEVSELRKLIPQIKTIAKGFTATYNGGTGKIEYTLIDRPADVVTFESIPSPEQRDLRRNPYFSGVEINWILQLFTAGTLFNAFGFTVSLTGKPLEYAVALRDGKSTYIYSRQTIRKTTITANETALVDLEQTGSKIETPTVPDGLPFKVKTGVIFLKHAPQCSFDGATYRIVETWEETDQNPNFYPA